MDEQQKKNLMLVAAVGGGGLLLFVVMKNKGTTINPPVQAASGPGSGISSGSYVTPFWQPSPNSCNDASPCPPGQMCVAGVCVPGLPVANCTTLGCPPGHACINGVCVIESGSSCDTCVPPDVCVLGVCVHNHSPDPFKCSGDQNCPQGERCVNGACVADSGQCGAVSCADGYHCTPLPYPHCVQNGVAPAPTDQSPIAAMHFPSFVGAKGGGANPVPQAGKRTDSHPTAASDGTDFAYDWNLTSAYYSMRFH